MTLPFMPGIEIGLTLMLFLGGKGVIIVYCCTLIALSISYLIGQKIPLQKFAKLLDWLHLKKARDLILEMEPLFGPRKGGTGTFAKSTGSKRS